MLALALSLAAALGPASGVDARQGGHRHAARRTAARAGAPTIFKLPVPIAASEAAWMGTQQKLAFLGTQAGAAGQDVYLWEPAARRMGRATQDGLPRHDLVAAPDGRLAYVEHDARMQTGPSDPACQVGQDRIVVYDFPKGSKKPIFEGGNVVPHSLVWSSDGDRLAFLANGTDGVPHLALLESGKPLVVMHLPVPYRLTGLLGWVGDHDVMTTAYSPKGMAVLLRVGKNGLTALPSGVDPRLSPDGRLLLSRASDTVGVLLRGAAGGGHTLNQVATSYAWGPKGSVLVTIGSDLFDLAQDGHALKRYPGAAGGRLDEMLPSPDGRYLAMLAANVLMVLVL